MRSTSSTSISGVVFIWEKGWNSAAGVAEFWELGPGGVLSGLARRTEKSWPVKSFSEFADVSAA